MVLSKWRFAILLAVLVIIGSAERARAIALNDDGNARLVGSLIERAWNRVARLLRRPPASGWDERLVGFRREAVGLLRRRWLALTAATLAGHLTVFVVLIASVRAVGIPRVEVTIVVAGAPSAHAAGSSSCGSVPVSPAAKLAGAVRVTTGACVSPPPPATVTLTKGLAAEARPRSNMV